MPLIVVPRTCYLPAVLRNGGRRFGLAAHLYSLRRQGDQGIGDFTTLCEAGAATARAGGVVVGLNPLHALFSADRDRASPYQPSDRRFLDPIYIDIESVPDLDASPHARRVLARHAQTIMRLSERSLVDYAEVWRTKMAVLSECFRVFERRRRDDGLVMEFARYVRDGGPTLMRFATFEAIAVVHPKIPWANWPAALRQPEGRAVADFAEGHADSVRFTLYLQWLADRQLRDASAQSREQWARDRALSRPRCRCSARRRGSLVDAEHACAWRFDRRAPGSICSGRTDLEPAATDTGCADRRGI